jgi:RNA polymerase subunit RPABC4/transcription elongation factor Spt4
MALVLCKECSKEVSDAALRCPGCGAKLKMHTFSKLLIIILGFVIIILVLSVVNSIATPQYKKDAIAHRNICEKYIADNNPVSIAWRRCQDLYNDAIRKGESIGKPIVAAPEFKEERLKMDESLKAAEIQYSHDCINNKKQIIAEYNKLSAQNEWYKAGLKVWRCAELTNDMEFKSLGERAKQRAK